MVDVAGRSLARIHGGPGIIRAREPDVAADAIISLVRDALEAAGHPAPADALCCGLAGAGDPDAHAAVVARLEAAGVASHVLVVSDAEVALHDAFGDRPGLLVIAGTGSIAVGRGRTGRLERVGGWGALIGDEGSGWSIGIGALRAILRAHDGRDSPTALTRIVATPPEELSGWAARAPKADIAALAPAVIALAGADAAAARITSDAVAALAEQARTLAAKLRVHRVALAGGLVRRGGPLRERVVHALHDFEVSDLDVDPARGAASMAHLLSPS